MRKPEIINFKSIGLLSLTFLLACQSLYAQVSNFKGQSLFIYNFAKHIKWPETPREYTVGVIGSADFYKELHASLKGKQVDGVSFHVKSITSMAEVANCQIVYLPSSASNNLNALISAIGNQDILVITENDLVEKGAGISFLMVENKIRFRLNQTVLLKHGLQVSYGLVSLAVK